MGLEKVLVLYQEQQSTPDTVGKTTHSHSGHSSKLRTISCSNSSTAIVLEAITVHLDNVTMYPQYLAEQFKKNTFKVFTLNTPM